MSIPVSVRFEVFKRDRFTCSYCGRSPADGVVLEERYRAWMEYLEAKTSAAVCRIWDLWIQAFDGRKWEENGHTYWEASVAMPSRSPLARYIHVLSPGEMSKAVNATASKWIAGGLDDDYVLRYFFGTLRSMAGYRMSGTGSAQDENDRLRDLFLNREDYGFATFADVVAAVWPEPF